MRVFASVVVFSAVIAAGSAVRAGPRRPSTDDPHAGGAGRAEARGPSGNGTSPRTSGTGSAARVEAPFPGRA